MKKIISLEFVPTGVEEMLDKQVLDPFYQSVGVDEILRNHPYEATRKVAIQLYMLGYIDGKRADRARRRKGTA